MSDGSRTFFLLSDEYLSADWQMNRTDSDAFKLAMNLLFYATDLGELEGKFASILPATPPAKPRDRELTVARVRHARTAGRPRDWDAAAACWQKLAPYVRHVTGCELKEASPVTLGRDSLDGIQLLHITGRGRCSCRPTERAALKQFAAAGRDGAGRRLCRLAGLRRVGRGRSWRPCSASCSRWQPTDLLAEGRFEGGVDLSTGVRFKLPARQLLRGRGEEPQGQKLLVARVGRRPGRDLLRVRPDRRRRGHRELPLARLQARLRPPDPRQSPGLPGRRLAPSRLINRHLAVVCHGSVSRVHSDRSHQLQHG